MMLFNILVLSFECLGKISDTTKAAIGIRVPDLEKREESESHLIQVNWVSFYPPGTIYSVSDKVATSVIEKLNENYARLDLPITFNLSSYSDVGSAEFTFINYSDDKLQSEVYESYGIKGKNILNVYNANTFDMENEDMSIKSNSVGSYIRSWSSFPTQAEYDGIFFNSNGFFRGGMESDADMQQRVEELIRSFVHETFHWFGLLHTFEGGCDDKDGDYIDDTSPAESVYRQSATSIVTIPISMTWDNDTVLSSCRNGKFDNLDNIMDYTSFGNMITPNQKTRVLYFMKKYRQ